MPAAVSDLAGFWEKGDRHHLCDDHARMVPASGRAPTEGWSRQIGPVPFFARVLRRNLAFTLALGVAFLALRAPRARHGAQAQADLIFGPGFTGPSGMSIL